MLVAFPMIIRMLGTALDTSYWRPFWSESWSGKKKQLINGYGWMEKGGSLLDATEVGLKIFYCVVVYREQPRVSRFDSSAKQPGICISTLGLQAVAPRSNFWRFQFNFWD